MPNLIQRIYNAVIKQKVKVAPSAHVVPIQLQRIAQDSQTRKEAIAEAERAYFPYRYKIQQMFLNTVDNGHIKACMERRKDLTLLRKFEIKNLAGEVDQKTSEIFCENKDGNLVPKAWFINFINHSLDALFFGYTLIQLGDLIDGNFPKLKVVKRWNVSPDRYELMAFPYMLSGIKFLEDEKYKDWYVYIDTPNDLGTSDCGYGLLYDISIYEIFLRNLLGFNGSFVELFAQPFRWGKTLKTSEDERNEFASMLQNIGSSGWGMGDPTDEIQFIESSLGGTGYKSYDNLEVRLQKLISKVILGHADALDSIPGKLGNNDEESPAQQAMEDKQTKDGMMLQTVIQDLLFNNLRNLGFVIPDGTTFNFKNDAEVMENANTVTDLAVKIKQAGLQMDEKYYFEQTGIKVAAPVVVSPLKAQPFTKSIQNRLREIYR